MQDFFVQVHHQQLRVQKIEPKTLREGSPILVFLHEGLGCIELWKDVPQRICDATSLQAVVFDRQGYGKSSPLKEQRPIDYLQQEALYWLPETLKQLNIKNPFLVGHSDGGTIALVYASRYPTVAVISEAAHVYVEDVTLEGIRAAQQVYQTTNLEEKLARYHGNQADVLFRAWSETWTNPAFRDWNVEHYLSELTCPLLVLQGANDEYATDAHVQSILDAAATKDKQGIILPDCAHVPHLQAKELTINTMVDFIHQVLK